MTDVHQRSKVDCLFVSVCFQNKLLLAFDFLQLPGWNRLKFLPFLLQCCFRIRNFHRLRQRKKLVNQIEMGHRVVSFACDVVFIIFRLRWFQTLSLGLVRLRDTCMLCFWNLVGFTTLRFSCPEASNVSLFLLCMALTPPLELPTFSSHFWRFLYILRLGSSIADSCFSLFWAAFPIWVHTASHIFRSVVAWFVVSISPDHKIPVGGFSFNNVSFVNPVQESDKLRFACTFQKSSKRFSCNTSRFV